MVNELVAIHFGANWSRTGWDDGVKSLKTIENMVARDGVEPPTPAFSECGLTTVFKNLQGHVGLPSSCK